MSNTPLQAAESDYAAKRADYDAENATLSAARDELARLEAKRDELTAAIASAKDDAEQHRAEWQAKIKGVAADFLAGQSKIPVTLAEPRLSAKMADALSDELGAVLGEVERMIEAQHVAIAQAARVMQRAHMAAVRAYGRREALATAADVFGKLRRAQAIVGACETYGVDDAPGRDINAIRGVQLPLLPSNAPALSDAEATDGLGRPYTIANEVEACERRAGLRA